MKYLDSILKTLSKEERAEFVTYLKGRNKRNDTKNVALFKLLCSQEVLRDIDVVIYGKRNKNALHALSKRLFDNLIDFIASKSFENERSEDLQTLKFLVISNVFFEKEQFQLAFKMLRKAESKALALEQFSILNEIYYTRIQYAHLDVSIDFENLLKVAKQNKVKLLQEEGVNLFCASIQQEFLKPDRNYAKLVEELLVKFDVNVSEDFSYRSLVKVVTMANFIGYRTRNYKLLLPFIERTYSIIKDKEQITGKKLFHDIQILYFVANAYFRNKAFDDSMRYLSLMEFQMQKDKRYKHLFEPQYVLLKAFNLNYTGNFEAAISMLENFPYKRYLKNQSSYIFDLKLSLIVYYLQQERFREGLRLINTFRNSDQWYVNKTSLVWVIKKNLIELLIHIELDHIDIVDARINSFRKKYNGYLKQQGEHKALGFLKLIALYHKTGGNIDVDDFSAKIESIFGYGTDPDIDIFDLSFYAWLKAKTLRENVYKTTLDVVSVKS